MAELHNSKLLSMILEQAEALGREYECKGTPRDFIVIAAIRLLSRETEGVDTAEREKALALVSRYSKDDAKLSHVLESWRGKETSMLKTKRKPRACRRSRRTFFWRSSQNPKRPA